MTGLESTEQEIEFVCSKAAESYIVELDASCIVILPPMAGVLSSKLDKSTLQFAPRTGGIGTLRAHELISQYRIPQMLAVFYILLSEESSLFIFILFKKSF